MESEPERAAAKAKAQKEKLEALERKLGIDPKAPKEDSSGGDPPVLAGKKHRFDDTEYIEQSRELVDGVKSAVTAGMFYPLFPLMLGLISLISPPEEEKESKGGPRTG